MTLELKSDQVFKGMLRRTRHNITYEFCLYHKQQAILEQFM